jgi:hypothetical protein
MANLACEVYQVKLEVKALAVNKATREKLDTLAYQEDQAMLDHLLV